MKYDDSKTRHEQFNVQSGYFVAFAAVVIGLGSFKQELVSHHVTLFNWYPTVLGLLIPTAGFLLLAIWLVALKILADSWGITRVKVSGMLAWAAIYTNLIGLLLWPALVALVWLIHIVSMNKDGLGYILQSLTSILGFLAAFYIGRSVARAEKRARLQEALSLSENATGLTFKLRRPTGDDDVRSRDTGSVSLYVFLKEYEELTEYMRAYLTLVGYGVDNLPFRTLALTFFQKELINVDDYNMAERLRVSRNNFAHGAMKATQKELEQCVVNTRLLRDRVSMAYTKLIGTENE